MGQDSRLDLVGVEVELLGRLVVGLELSTGDSVCSYVLAPERCQLRLELAQRSSTRCDLVGQILRRTSSSVDSRARMNEGLTRSWTSNPLIAV
jgi:hypothetical protein